MTESLLQIAVVGHTNTGKTSLLRTLMRQSHFGEVSSSPSTTKHVEGITLLIEGEPCIAFYDTPGIEDPMALADYFDGQPALAIEAFLGSDVAAYDFEQEAKTLRQLLRSHVALYVVDVRDPMLGKHRDELIILGKCARPIIPVLNFTASEDARTEQWRHQLAELGLFSVVSFDTIVLDGFGEELLYQKIQMVLDPFHDLLDTVINHQRRARQRLRYASTDAVADMLLDVAGFRMMVSAEQREQVKQATEQLKDKVRQREEQIVQQLLELHQFGNEDYQLTALPLSNGRWGLDPFSRASLKQFGMRAGGSAAVGSAAGVAVDILSAGVTLGVGLGVGAAVGVLWSGMRTYGKQLTDRLRGFAELRPDDSTIRLLAVRQTFLVASLLRRGHASQQQIRLKEAAEDTPALWKSRQLPEALQDAQVNPAWSRLNDEEYQPSESGRLAAKEELSRLISDSLTQTD